MIDTWLANIAAYSLQLAVLVVTTLAAMRILPVSNGRWRLTLLQVVFVVALALPVLQLWVDTGSTRQAGALFSIATSQLTSSTSSWAFWVDAVALVLGAGVVIRLARLTLGWLAIRGYVDRATPLASACVQASTGWDVATGIDVRLSGDVNSPATVGIYRPVILVPPAFLALPRAAQGAVLLHEAEHVRRRDWLRMILEEVWCALLWTAMRPRARILYSLHRRTAVLAARSAARDTGNQPRVLRGYQGVSPLAGFTRWHACSSRGSIWRARCWWIGASSTPRATGVPTCRPCWLSRTTSQRRRELSHP